MDQMQMKAILDKALEFHRAGNYAESLKLFEQAAEAGNAWAQYQCGIMYGKGKGTAKDNAKALAWIRKAAAQGDKDAKAFLEGLQANGGASFEAGVKALREKNYAEALRQFESSAKLGNVSAVYNLGLMHQRGLGTPVDEAKALYWFEKAAEAGYAKAQYQCGDAHFLGRKEENLPQAFYWYGKAAEQGLAEAQVQLGTMLSDGLGTKRDEVKALYWYERAAEQGDVRAQYLCGSMYLTYEGLEGENRLAKSQYWFEKAAEQDHIQGQYHCANGYYNGYGVAVDKARARYWFERAAAGTPRFPLDDRFKEAAKKALLEYF